MPWFRRVLSRLGETLTATTLDHHVNQPPPMQINPNSTSTAFDCTHLAKSFRLPGFSDPGPVGDQRMV